MLNAHGMHATYFVNSPRIGGDSAYMTWSNVADLAAAGNEIGGHTAYHADLPFIDPTEAQRQICYDRDNLLHRGYNADRLRLSVRRLQPGGEVDGAELRLQLRPHAPTSSRRRIRPGRFRRRIPTRSTSAPTTPTLTSMENAVTAARQNGGGWVPIVFHHICNACNIDYITPSDFNTFLDWLQGQAANNGRRQDDAARCSAARRSRRCPVRASRRRRTGRTRCATRRSSRTRTATASRTVGRTTTSATTTSAGRARATRTPAPSHRS